MFDITPNGLKEIIKDGESDTVEFKSYLPPDNVIAQNLIAFANTRGGILIIGVGDRGEVIGLPEAEIKKVIAKLRRISSSLCDWSVQIGSVDIENKKVAFIALDKAPVHLAPVMTSSGEVYVRRSDFNISLAEEEKLDFLKRHRPALQGEFNQHEPNQPCKVFVAMSFREEQEPALVDYYRAIERAITRTGLNIELRKMDLMEGDYEISQAIMEEIRAADIVVTDFTLNSSNVYFELGYARGCNKRVIQTARKDTVLEFDVRNWRTLIYRNATELEEKILLELAAAHAEVMG